MTKKILLVLCYCLENIILFLQDLIYSYKKYNSSGTVSQGSSFPIKQRSLMSMFGSRPSDLLHLVSSG